MDPLCLPVRLFSIIFFEWHLIWRFRNLVNCPSQWSILPKEDLAICDLTNFGSQDAQQIDYISKSDRMIRRAALKKVPRPLNSFILYRKDRQEIVKQDHPGLCNNDICKFKEYITAQCMSLTSQPKYSVSNGKRRQKRFVHSTNQRQRRPSLHMSPNTRTTSIALAAQKRRRDA